MVELVGQGFVERQVGRGVDLVLHPAHGGRRASSDLLRAGPDGGVELDASEEATIELNTAPTDPPVAATVQVPLFTENLVGLKATRFVSWQRARTTSAAYVSGVTF